MYTHISIWEFWHPHRKTWIEQQCRHVSMESALRFEQQYKKNSGHKTRNWTHKELSDA